MSVAVRQPVKGRLHVVARDPDGRIVDERRANNRITRAGKRLLANYFLGHQREEISLQVVVGSSGATIEGEPTLEQIQNPTLVPAVLEPPTELEEEGEVLAVATLSGELPRNTDGEDLELREAGIVVRVGEHETVLYNRVTFPVVNKTKDMQLTLAWEVLF